MSVHCFRLFEVQEEASRGVIAPLGANQRILPPRPTGISVGKSSIKQLAVPFATVIEDF